MNSSRDWYFLVTLISLIVCPLTKIFQTHTLCYGFHRATKAVSICAPAYCADLLAERGRCYLYKEFNDAPSTDGDSDVSTAAWTGGVHPDIRDSMYYI